MKIRPLRPVAATATAAVLAFLPACSSVDPGGDGTGGDGTGSEPAAGWAPAPHQVGRLAVLARSDADGLRIHTESGDRNFVAGVNLGSTTPLHQPGELAIEREDYRRWFAQMGDLGIRSVRVYTIHPPAFYQELAAYNRAHEDAPLYLVQGVYLPDESYVEEAGTLYDRVVDEPFSEELADASAAVHGDLERAATPGRASGRWDTDVSRWLLAWIVGVEWDPAGTRRTDVRFADAPYSPGRFFRATDDATATERWIAGHLDHLASLEAARGVSVPIAVSNWPTTDPLAHPDEPLAGEDLVGVDAEHVLPTRAWPGGTFADFHAYPYYPDFLRHEPALAEASWEGRRDAYAGYLQALRRHFRHMPVVVGEVGVPSSLGSAHLGTNGRDQGGHTEREAMEIDADLLRLAHDQGMAGAFLFSWTDEWFKRTWNTMEHQVPAERRQLWHDPLTNEQWFGILATDSQRIPDAARELAPPEGPVEYVLADADASWVYLDVTFRDGLPGSLRLEADAVAEPDGADHRFDVDLVEQRAQAKVRAELDPTRLDAASVHDRAAGSGGWRPYRLLVNRSYLLHGRRLPAEFQEVGDLREGSWDPADPAYDSLATWQADEQHRTVRLRLPWPMLGMADPSSRTALGPGNPATTSVVDGITFTVVVDGRRVELPYTWPTWNYVEYDERVKQGAEGLADTFRSLDG